jgi:hypothetical protein
MAGWGTEKREPAGWLVLRKKHTPFARTPRFSARPRAANLFGVRPQALRLLCRICTASPSINLLIPRQFGGQCAMLNGNLAVEQKYPGNFAGYW